jgi:3',5'-cyclic AMP phosphodiesterase CpdA
MKIAHISDLHINAGTRNSNLEEVKILLKHANKYNVDHLVITGDISDDSHYEDFEELRELLDKYDFLSSERLSIVVGNHDIFGGIQSAEDILHFPERCKHTEYETKILEFNAFFQEAFDNCVFKSNNNSYPFAKIFNDVLIIGMNSTHKYSPFKNPIASNGGVDAYQLLEVKKILDNYNENIRHRLILIHHHFNKIALQPQNFVKSIWKQIEKQTMKLRKRKRIINFFAENKIDLVLHGHLHNSEEYKRKNVRFINAGASIKNESFEDLYLNIIKIEDKITYNLEVIKPGRDFMSRRLFKNKNHILSNSKMPLTPLQLNFK